MKPEPRYKTGNRIANRYQVHDVKMGGMGEVYLCLDLEENYPYALKTFQQRYLTDPQRLRRAFEQEVATWVALEKHPNIVRCHWMQLLDHQPFVCLEWIAGEEGRGTDLRSWLRRGPLDLKLAMQIAIDICQGLLHAQIKCPGLVHCDLKPENILIAQGGLAKITDFGLAQLAQTAGLVLNDAGVTSDCAAQERRQSLMGDHGIVGTPAYMAPEQWRNEPLDARTDIYALGCILYELLTGDLPFPVTVPATPDQNAAWLRAMQAAHQYGRIPELPQAIPLALNQLLRSCLAKVPLERPTDLVDLIRQLTNIYRTSISDYLPTQPEASSFTGDDYNNRGLTYTALRQYQAALTDYCYAIELDANNTKAYSNRGLAYHELAQYEMALTDFTFAIKLDANFAQAYSNRGRTYHSLGQYKLAMDDFNYALNLNPDDASSYSNRGATYKMLGQYEVALADYNRAVKLEPNFAEVYSNRGIIYSSQGKYVAALSDHNQAIKLNPYYAEAYTNRGITHKILGNLKEALTDYNRAIELDSNFAQAYYNRGIIYIESKQFLAALDEFSLAIKCNPTFVEAYLNRGAIYEELGQYAKALANYERVIEFNPHFALAYLNIGVLLGNQGRLTEALSYFEKATQLGHPQGAQHAAQARKRLGLDPAPPSDPAQTAFAAFQQADSLVAMQQAVTHFPLLRQPDFIAPIEQAIAQFPPEHRPALTQRLTWLRQIAKEQSK